MNVKCLALALLNPTSDQNLTYPYSKTAQSFTKIMRIIEMMANQTLIVKPILLASTKGMV